MYDALFFDPLFNLFLWLIELSAMQMGIGIVLLTIFVRLLLYMPMHRSMMNSKTMQELQPKIQKIREEHKDDQQQLAMATMSLYKEHGVNPFSSCLPVLLQIPVLLAVFGVLRLDFTDTEILSEHSYTMFANFPLSDIIVNFLSFDMSLVISEGVKQGGYAYAGLAAIVGVLQYFSLRLAMRTNHKKVTDITPNENKEPAQMQQMEQMSKMMTKFLPIFVAVISYTFQAGLSIYWAVSTIFGIGQQLLINYLWKRRNAATDENVKVEVID